MPRPIAFITRLDAAEEDHWRAVLADALPEERIVLLRDMTPDEQAAADVAIVANPDPADVAALPSLVWVQSLWAGVERLVSELGPGAPAIVRLVDPEMARVMAESVLAWTHYLQRDMPVYARQQRARVWEQRPYREPKSMTVGLLGLGELGAASARALKGAGFNVVGWSRSPKTLEGVRAFDGDAGMTAALGLSDIVVCLLPLTAATRGLLDAARFGAMKPGAALINFARGPIVVDHDLIAALDAGRLSHAVLDVFHTEPLPEASPFWDHPAVTVLPHIAAATGPDTAAVVVAENIRRYRETGRLPQTVDLTRGY